MHKTIPITSKRKTRNLESRPEDEVLAMQERKVKEDAILPASIDISTMAHTTPHAMDFVLPGFLAGTVGALVSPGGAGKSMLALQLACQLAGGGDTLGIATGGTGRVLYLAAEDPEIVLHHRIRALAGMERAAGSLEIIPVTCINILNTSTRDAIARRADGARLVIMDTLRRFHQAEENDGRAMVHVISVMESISKLAGVSVLFLHHANKSAALSGMGGEQQASRGSSVLVDNIRWQAFLAGMSKQEAKTHSVDENDRCSYVRFGISKMNYAAPVADRWYRRGAGGVLGPVELENEVDPDNPFSDSFSPRRANGYQKAAWR